MKFQKLTWLVNKEGEISAKEFMQFLFSSIPIETLKNSENGFASFVCPQFVETFKRSKKSVVSLLWIDCVFWENIFWNWSKSRLSGEHLDEEAENWVEEEHGEPSILSK